MLRLLDRAIRAPQLGRIPPEPSSPFSPEDPSCLTSFRSKPKSAIRQASRPPADGSACPSPSKRTVELYSGEATGLAVQLPGWKYPLVCHTASGQVQFDNFGGHWGEQARLDQFLQAYAAEKTKLEARKQGHSVTEQGWPTARSS